MDLKLKVTEISLGVLLETIARILFGSTEVRITIESYGFNVAVRFTVPNNKMRTTTVYYDGGQLKFSNPVGVFFPFEELPKISKLFEILAENNFEEQLRRAHRLVSDIRPTNYLTANTLKIYQIAQQELKQLGLAEFKQFRDFCSIDFVTIR